MAEFWCGKCKKKTEHEVVEYPTYACSECKTEWKAEKGKPRTKPWYHDKYKDPSSPSGYNIRKKAKEQASA